jgi:hypothetical protein
VHRLPTANVEAYEPLTNGRRESDREETLALARLSILTALLQLRGLFSGTANPLTGAPGAAPLYIVAGMIVWPRGNGRLGLLGEGGAIAAWAGLWLGSAVLWILPANSGAGAVHDAFAAVPSGTGWLTSLLNSAASATAGHGTTIALIMAALSAAIGVSIVTGLAARTFLAIGIGLSLVFWIVGQGLGGIFTGTATDVSTAPLVILIGALLLALRPWPAADPVLVPASVGASPA